MKHPYLDDYESNRTELCERALLTVWPYLADFHPNLSLVGGLVPRYLCRKLPLETQTIDVDLGISIASGEGGSYSSLSFRLRSAGFRLEKNRYVKKIGEQSLFLDFLTEASDSPGGVMTVEDVLANTFHGVERAVEMVREVPLEGTDLLGARVKETIRICEVGPFLCLKLLAYGQRGERKDLFDIVQMIQGYDQGPRAATDLFHQEREYNPAYPAALKVLQERFTDETGRAAVHYAEFCVGAQSGTIPSDDFRLLRQQHINTAVTAGLILKTEPTENSET